MLTLLSFCSFPWWLAWLLPFLLGLLAGWAIWSRYKSKYDSLYSDYEYSQREIHRLKEELNNCTTRSSSKENEFDRIKNQLREKENELLAYRKSVEKAALKKRTESIKSQGIQGTSTLAATPVVTPASSGSTSKASVYSKIKKGNLQIVEGIGPKMESVLKDNGITTYSELGLSNTTHIQGILDKYEDKYRIIDPGTWVQQAKLAHEGKWEELIELQKQLDAGKDNAANETDSKLEKLMVKMGLIKKWKKDDLTAVEGIGPAISKLLMSNGISTWRNLGDAPLDKLKSILEAAGSRFALANPETWAQQADLADRGEFDQLQELQDLLDGGRTK